MRFSATLHDRNTGQPSPAIVRAEPGVLFIELENGHILDWTLNDIASARAPGDGSVILQSGKLFLEVKYPDFRRTLERSFPKNRLFRQSFFDRIGIAGCLISILAVVAPLLLIYFFLLPFIAAKAAGKVSPVIEKKIGESRFQTLTAIYETDTANSNWKPTTMAWS